MKLKILGTVSPYPKGKCNCSSMMLILNDKKIMLDAGFGINRELESFDDLRNLTIIISNYEIDHIGDLFVINNRILSGKKNGFINEKINIYLPTIKNDLKYGSLIDILVKSEAFNVYMYDENTKIQIEDGIIQFDNSIKNTNNYSVKVFYDGITLVYSSNNIYEKNTLVDFSKSADLLICESTYILGHPKYTYEHLYASEAAKIADKAMVKNLCLFHTFPEIEKRAYLMEAKKYFDNVYMLNEGEIIKLERKLK